MKKPSASADRPKQLVGGNIGARSECAGCGEVFNGVEPFDAHRTGRHGTDERRCLTAAEMRRAGLLVGAYGRWSRGARGRRTDRKSVV